MLFNTGTLSTDLWIPKRWMKPGRKIIRVVIFHQNLLLYLLIVMLWILHGVSSWSTCIHQFSSVTQLCLTVCNHMNCSMPGFPVHHQLLELARTHVHWVGGAIQPSNPLLPSPPPAFNLSQHQGLFQWISSSHQAAKALELQLQHQSFQWIVRIDFF